MWEFVFGLFFGSVVVALVADYLVIEVHKAGRKQVSSTLRLLLKSGWKHRAGRAFRLLAHLCRIAIPQNYPLQTHLYLVTTFCEATESELNFKETHPKGT
jgi:hypothetical protein